MVPNLYHKLYILIEMALTPSNMAESNLKRRCAFTDLERRNIYSCTQSILAYNQPLFPGSQQRQDTKSTSRRSLRYSRETTYSEKVL
jgi:hypothetical protein